MAAKNVSTLHSYWSYFSGKVSWYGDASTCVTSERLEGYRPD